VKKRHYRQALDDILEAIHDIEQFTAGVGRDDLGLDRKTLFAVAKALENIGEAVKQIPVAIRHKHPDVPWQDIAGMRDVLVHDYFGINADILWKTVRIDVPVLKRSVREIVSGLAEPEEPPIARDRPRKRR
jgi:uncharacterized protein with HEPN domain